MLDTKKPSVAPVPRMFSDIVPRYDFINHLMTWGRDAYWRHQTARECLSLNPQRVLDLAAGTGDMTRQLLFRGGTRRKITALDASPQMLQKASRKLGPLNSAVDLVTGEAAGLPFMDGAFDCVVISFAFRSMTYRNNQEPVLLAEIRRVLREKGLLVIVENSQPPRPLVRRLYHLYLRLFVAGIGTLVSGNRKAYRFLAQSSVEFASADELKARLLNSGFQMASYRRFTQGAVAIHLAAK